MVVFPPGLLAWLQSGCWMPFEDLFHTDEAAHPPD